MVSGTTSGVLYRTMTERAGCSLVDPRLTVLFGQARLIQSGRPPFGRDDNPFCIRVSSNLQSDIVDLQSKIYPVALPGFDL